MDKSQKREILDNFKSGTGEGLIATDILARGINVQDLDLVIMLDLPRKIDEKQPDDETYIHRAARCGRQERPGLSVLLVSDQYKEKVGENTEYCTDDDPKSSANFQRKIRKHTDISKENPEQIKRKKFVILRVLKDIEQMDENIRKQSTFYSIKKGEKGKTELQPYFYYTPPNGTHGFKEVNVKTGVDNWAMIPITDTEKVKEIKYVHDEACSYFVMEFSNGVAKCVFAYYPSPLVKAITIRDGQNTNPWDKPSKVFFKSRLPVKNQGVDGWMSSGSYSREELIRCFDVLTPEGTYKCAAENIEAPIWWDAPLLLDEGSDKEWIRSMEQQYSKSSSMKYVIGEQGDNNLILNAGRLKDILNPTGNDNWTGHKLLYPMKSTVQEDEGFSISHFQDMGTDEEKKLPLRNASSTSLFYYSPLTKFYTDDPQKKLKLNNFYENVDEDDKWTVRRVILRYNFDVKISWNDTWGTSSSESKFVHFLYMQKDNNYMNGATSIENQLDTEFAALNPAEHISQNLAIAEEKVRGPGGSEWSILRRERYSKNENSIDPDTYESHGYLVPEQTQSLAGERGNKNKSYLKVNESQELIMEDFPICLLIVKSHEEIVVDVYLKKKDLVSYVAFEVETN